MPDDDSQQIAGVDGPTKRPDFSPPVPGDDWDRIVVPMLWIGGAALVVNQIAERVLPGYPDPSIPILLVALTYLRLRGEFIRRYSLVKRGRYLPADVCSCLRGGPRGGLAFSRLWPGW